MSQFRLYRIQVFQEQRDLLQKFPKGSEVLHEVLQNQLELNLKTRKYYAIGLKKIDDKSYHFKLARTRIVKTTEFEREEPIEILHEDNPYVDVFIDYDLEICALSRNSKFSATWKIASDKLKNILMSSNVVEKYKAEIVIDPIIDPTDFIEHINKSSVITKFYFETRRPNVIDTSIFTKSIKELTQDANAKKSKTLLEGDNLSKEIAKDIARVAASTGDNAGATLFMPHKSKSISKSLEGSSIDFEINVDLTNDFSEVVDKMRNKYEDVRHDK